MSEPLGRPRLHLRVTDSTNTRAQALAAAGAPHGTLVTAREQLAGRGRQGRAWSSPPGTSLAMSLIVREPPELLSLVAGVAVAETVDVLLADTGSADSESCVSNNLQLLEEIRHATSDRTAGQASRTQIKWPNDVLSADGRKLAGILVESRPQERWAVLGIGLNVAIPPDAFPPELRERAGTLGLDAAAIEPALRTLLALLERWLGESTDAVLAAIRERDALLGRAVTWADGRHSGTAIGIDAEGRLCVRDGSAGENVALDAGEVHLGALPAATCD